MFRYTRTVLVKGETLQSQTEEREGTAEEFLIDMYAQMSRSYSELVEYKNGIVHVSSGIVTVIHAENI
jgi:hypothetical protein